MQALLKKSLLKSNFFSEQIIRFTVLIPIYVENKNNEEKQHLTYNNLDLSLECMN